DTGELAAVDKRLDRRVKFVASRVRLGELLDHITKLSGARVEADDRIAPISGYELAVSFRERPAREVMQAIRRLYDARSDRWYWTHEGTGSEERYVIHNSLTPGELARARQAYCEAYVLDERRRQNEILGLSSEKRGELARRDP